MENVVYFETANTEQFTLLLTLNSLIATPNASIVSMSRWFVGSSKIRKFGLKKKKYFLLIVQHLMCSVH